MLTYIYIYIPNTQTVALKDALHQYYERINSLEDLKYDLEYVVKRKDIEVHTNIHIYIYIYSTNELTCTQTYIYIYIYISAQTRKQIYLTIAKRASNICDASNAASQPPPNIAVNNFYYSKHYDLNLKVNLRMFNKVSSIPNRPKYSFIPNILPSHLGA